jgi:hypothetical protein
MKNKPAPVKLILGDGTVVLDSGTWVLEGESREFLGRHVQEVADRTFFSLRTIAYHDQRISRELTHASFGVRKGPEGSLRFSLGRKEDYRSRGRNLYSEAKRAYADSMSDRSAVVGRG